MRRAWSRKGAAAAACLVAALLPLAPAVALPTNSTILETTYNITALPESCGYLRKDFGAYIFDYTAAWSSNATVPDHCTLEISLLFKDGACSGSGFWADCGLKVGGNNASCETVVRGGRASWWDASSSWWTAVRPNAPGTTTFASGEICGDAPSLGYFYIHNSCNLTLTFSVKVIVQPRSSCHLSAGIGSMAFKVLSLLWMVLGTAVIYLEWFIVGTFCTALMACLLAGVVCGLYEGLRWVAIRVYPASVQAFRAWRHRLSVAPAPPAVQLGPVGACGAAATEDTSLIDSGHVHPRAHESSQLGAATPPDSDASTSDLEI